MGAHGAMCVPGANAYSCAETTSGTNVADVRNGGINTKVSVCALGANYANTTRIYEGAAGADGTAGLMSPMVALAPMDRSLPQRVASGKGPAALIRRIEFASRHRDDRAEMDVAELTLRALD